MYFISRNGNLCGRDKIVWPHLFSVVQWVGGLYVADANPT